MNAPNNAVVKSDGIIWFTDPLYGISTDYEGGRQMSEQAPALYRFDPECGDIRVMAGDFDGPNGLAFSPDERRLYVAETGDQTIDRPRQYIRVFDVAAGGTSLAGGDVFHKVEPGASDGFRIDGDGCGPALAMAFIEAGAAADGFSGHCIDGALIVAARRMTTIGAKRPPESRQRPVCGPHG